MHSLRPSFLVLATLAVGLCGRALPAPIAVTIDDLPLQAVRDRGTADIAAINERLLAALGKHGIKAVGFVNEVKLEVEGTVDPGRVDVLSAWLAAGHELGNHSYSHPDLHATPVAEYLADIARGDTIIRPLAERHGSSVRYFRHPFLRTGRSIEVRDTVFRWLADHGYTVAPVTIDNSEWIFAAAYYHADRNGDEALKQRLGESYVDYMADKTAYFVANGRHLFGREIAQVLLLHVNLLNADWFDALAARLTSEGHTFLPLEAALADPAYESRDLWTGPGGISWLHRWLLAVGDRSQFADEPRTPPWVLEAAGLDAE
ncbi:polysaccharide deacetylase family protein [Halomonas denitrificans]|nr:polysaccharide deacetylase family protein [Halomonas denitrificans]